MADCRAGLISSVVVFSFSRFARSTTHLLDALQEFNKHKIGFVSITEQIDTQTPMGRTLCTILAAIGELERNLIRERIMSGLKNAAAKGLQPY
jgi:DNA invertase Pin-like site-specific DNA recombinase